MTLWSGRVDTSIAAEVGELLHADDAELFFYDVEGTRLHARRLAAASVLTDDELDSVERLLDGLAWEPGHEDVHTVIEVGLGELGRKIQAGRSRNDQVATALRLYVTDASAEAVEAIERFARTVLDRAEDELETPMPGYTHLQRAQPVTVGHHLLAWVEMLDRDRKRFHFAREQSLPLPLGAAALAGSTLELPPPPGQTLRNSLDAVADRDFALDYLYACAVLASHLSRMGEELVLWASSEFAFVRLPERAATGSSAMPQKLNPDVAELVRGKAGTALGRLTALLATMKGLPLAYNRDLQEDKSSVFGARRDVRLSLGGLNVLVAELGFDRGRLAAASSDPRLLATDAAEELVRHGVPFRDAHERIAAEVRAGTFAPPSEAATRGAPGPGGVAAALEDARRRFGS
jgi:argininosuccinate lyase